MGRLALTNPASDIFHGYERAWDGTYCRRRMALRPEVQREKRVANIVMRLHHPRLPDPAHGRGILSAIFLAKPFISYEYSKRLHGGDAMSASLMLRHAWNVMREPFGTVGFLANWARRRTLAARKFPSLIVAPRNNVYSLDIHAEQVPNPESRVTLGAAYDAFGQPQARVDWRYRPLDLETVRVALHALRMNWRDGAAAASTLMKPKFPMPCSATEPMAATILAPHAWAVPLRKAWWMPTARSTARITSTSRARRRSQPRRRPIRR